MRNQRRTRVSSPPNARPGGDDGSTHRESGHVDAESRPAVPPVRGRRGRLRTVRGNGSFVLPVEMPGFERSDIDVNRYDGRLDVAAEHHDDARDRKRTYHRTFRRPNHEA
ncbi:Hsp20 family protein [Halobium palmae]|uniref:Hsp20 family protein n=1 Tax=Halobium palmae TaxID=1776492 RepID=A0ABD5S3L3_9EURY